MTATFTGKRSGGLPVGNNYSGPATLILERDQVRVEVPSWNLRGYSNQPADEIRYIAIEDGGTTSNVAALVTFGALGLGARRAWTMMTVGFPQGDVLLSLRKPLPSVRIALHRALQFCPSLEGRIVDGPPPLSPPEDDKSDTEAIETGKKVGAAAALDDLERLSEMRELGLIDDDEFAELKRRLVWGDEGPTESSG